jgi:hypothetical protein
MTGSDKEKSQEPSNIPTPAEDDSIIDLVEEIEEESPADLLLQLDRQLLGIGETLPANELPATQFPDLGKLDFEEDDEQPGRDGLSQGPARLIDDRPAENAGMDWLFDPAAGVAPQDRDEPPAESEAALLQEAVLEKPSLEAEPVLEPMDSPPAPADPADADDDLELIDIEEAEPDNELEWLDDLKLDKLPSFAGAPVDAAAPESRPAAADIDEFPETSAADVFAANVAFGGIALHGGPADSPPPQPAPPASAPLAPLSPAAPAQMFPEAPSAVEAAALSNEQIEAAVERLIERRLGGSLESIVRRAVETAVTKEIKRLQQLLLDYDLDDTAS